MPDSGNQPAKPKLSQIARLAGVSVTTASRALRGKGRINEQTVVKVRTVAQMLGYPTKPQTVAEHKARLVAVITHPPSQLAGGDGLEQTHTFWFRIFYGVVNRLTGQGSGVVWVTTESQNLLIPLPVSAIVLAALSVPRPEVIDLGYDVPIVVAGAPDESDDGRIKAHISYDNLAISEDVCTHLSKKGAKKIALAVRPAVGQPAEQWIEGYKNWCEREDQEPIVIVDELDPDALAEQITAALADGVDGIFLALPSFGTALRAIENADKQIPQDLLVVTWEETIDDTDEIPEFTRISPQALDASEVLADTIERMADGEPTQRVFLEYELTQGRSTLR